MRLLIVDDHAVILEALAAMLTRLIPDAAVVMAETCEHGLRVLAEGHGADIVLLDLMMPGVAGLAALAAFRTQHPSLPIIVLSGSSDPLHARQALSAGALGYVPKTASPRTLVSAIHMVMNGDIYVPPMLLSDVPAAPVIAAFNLTARQTDVLRLVVQGQSNKQIAQALDLSEKTVKFHVGAIFQRLGVARRSEAIERVRLMELGTALPSAGSA